MSDQIHEQVSKFVDDEMSVEECDFFVRRLERDRDARSRYLRYQLIGAVMRGERVQAGTSSAGVPRVAPASHWSRTGIAASIVLAAIVGFVGGDSVPKARSPVAESRELPLAGLQADDTGLQLLMHHAGTSSGVSRTLMHSSLFSPIESDGADSDQDEPIE